MPPLYDTYLLLPVENEQHPSTSTTFTAVLIPQQYPYNPFPPPTHPPPTIKSQDNTRIMSNFSSFFFKKEHATIVCSIISRLRGFPRLLEATSKIQILLCLVVRESACVGVHIFLKAVNASAGHHTSIHPSIHPPLRSDSLRFHTSHFVFLSHRSTLRVHRAID